MRVDFVTKEYPPNIYGGAGVHVSELVRNLRKQLLVRVHAFGKPLNEPDTFGYLVPKDFAESNPALQTLATNLTMVDSIIGSDLVHSHTWYANYAGQIASQLHGIPHVITAHSLEPLRPWKAEQLGGGYRVSSWIEKTAFLAASRVIAVSQGMRQDILRCYPEVEPEKVVVVHNGIDSNVWRPQSNQKILNEFGIEEDAQTVTFVGRITRQKGLKYFLLAARSLPESVQIVLCAGAPDNAEIAQEIHQLVSELKQSRSRVIWIEEHLPQQKLAAILSSTDLFVCPSIYEPLGIVNLEAMACGAAVIATETGGIPEVVVPGETGWLVPVNQVTDGTGKPIDEQGFVSDWSDALNSALQSGDLIERGRRGRERVLEHFAWDEIAAKTVDIYRGALG